MREEHVIERHGKKFALYPGLLDAAHAKGLRGIETFLQQIPSKQNGEVAVVLAMVEMEGGGKFSGIGDASPQNVSRGIVPHLIRMAETRAKARALRDAINASEAVLDDAGMEAPEVSAQPSEDKPSEDNVSHLRGQAQHAPPREENSVRKVQKDAIAELVHELWPGKEEAALQRILKEKGSLEELNRQEANDLIEWLNSLAHKEEEG